MLGVILIYVNFRGLPELEVHDLGVVGTLFFKDCTTRHILIEQGNKR